MILTNQQENAIKKTVDWFRSKSSRIWKIAGYAGTGKTTIIPYIVESLGFDEKEIAFMTPTGKAALNLRKKGIPAKTIHSTIYTRDVIEENDIKIVVWRLIPAIKCKLFVIDEISMVSDELMEDILSFNIPIITIGDPAQLQPVKGECTYLSHPDIMLSEIHRQGKDDPIIRLSMEIRNGHTNLVHCKYSKNVLITSKIIQPDILSRADIILTGTHKMRKALNKIMREYYGFNNKYFNLGEKVICKMNNKNIAIGYEDLEVPIANGIIGNIVTEFNENNVIDCLAYSDLSKETKLKHLIRVDFKPDFIPKESNTRYEKINICLDTLQFDDEKPFITAPRNLIIYMNYGYAITTHSSQGSEWDNVVVYNDFTWNKELNQRYLYTAITRAKNNLVIVI